MTTLITTTQDAGSADAAAEGAIHFRYRLTNPRVGDRLDDERFERLAAWRQILKQQKLIGRDRRRYEGFAFGNLSARDPHDPLRFFVTASQTGGTGLLHRKHITRVDRWNAERFDVDATGALPPSSESITHGMVYEADAQLEWIMHVHSPAIWRAAARLKLPVTAADVPYGSAAMAAAVGALMRKHLERPLVFATLGHEDGVFACGASANATGGALLCILADSLTGVSR